jgi:transposase-like protein
MLYVRFPLSLRNVEDLLFERGIDICHETVRHWGNRFGLCCQSKCTRKITVAQLAASCPGNPRETLVYCKK